MARTFCLLLQLASLSRQSTVSPQSVQTSTPSGAFQGVHNCASCDARRAHDKESWKDLTWWENQGEVVQNGVRQRTFPKGLHVCLGRSLYMHVVQTQPPSHVVHVTSPSFSVQPMPSHSCNLVLDSFGQTPPLAPVLKLLHLCKSCPKPIRGYENMDFHFITTFFEIF